MLPIFEISTDFESTIRVFIKRVLGFSPSRRSKSRIISRRPSKSRIILRFVRWIRSTRFSRQNTRVIRENIGTEDQCGIQKCKLLWNRKHYVEQLVFSKVDTMLWKLLSRRIVKSNASSKSKINSFIKKCFSRNTVHVEFLSDSRARRVRDFRKMWNLLVLSLKNV